MVSTIGEVIGRPLRYEAISPSEAAERIIALGLPPSFADAMVARYARELDNPYPVTDGVENTLGRPARSYAEWVVDHTSAFQSSPAA